jgi:two-component system, NarL family, sensor histidine kinase UhpB
MMSTTTARPLIVARFSVRRDLAIIAILFFFVGWLCARYDLSDMLLAVTRPFEKYHLDELPGVLLFIAAALMWFAWRRMRETQRELRARLAAENELRAAFETNQRLTRDNVRLLEQERRQLARELHDELGQSLNAIKIDAVTLRDAHRAPPPEIERTAQRIVAVVDHVEGIVHDIVGRLRPVGLDELGLPAAIDHCLEAWRRRMPAVRFDFAAPAVERDFGESANITLFRMVQEGLTNAAKHAHARHIHIALETREDAAQLRGEAMLTVRDDGVGVREPSAVRGLGLVGMRERVEALGGSFEAGPIAEGGFQLVACIPFALPST